MQFRPVPFASTAPVVARAAALAGAAAVALASSSALAAPTYLDQTRFVEVSLQNVPFGQTELVGPIERVEAGDFGPFDGTAGPIERDHFPPPPDGGSGDAVARLQSTLGDDGVEVRLVGSARLGEGRQFTPPFDAVARAGVSVTFELDAPHRYSIEAFRGDFEAGVAPNPFTSGTDGVFSVDDGSFDLQSSNLFDVNYSIGLTGPGTDVDATPLFNLGNAGEVFVYSGFGRTVEWASPARLRRRARGGDVHVHARLRA